ncbi:MAG: ferritin family protein [Desulfobulbaceae bacterium]|nr:ferritin family protein [Desulfobulbaceae bacterium]
MEGGIKAWRGETAAGVPEAGMAYFAAADSLETLVALAWGLEEGSRLFYQGVADRFTDTPAAIALFKELAGAEIRHKQYLLNAYRAAVGAEPDFERHRLRLGGALSGEIMEGGIPVDLGLAWAEGRTTSEILEFAMSMEVNAYDIYIKMERRIDDEKGKRIFQTLANEEHLHLRRLAELRETTG